MASIKKETNQSLLNNQPIRGSGRKIMDEIKRQLAAGLNRMSEWLTEEQATAQALARSSDADKADILYQSAVQAYNQTDYAKARNYFEKFLSDWNHIANSGAIVSSNNFIALIAYKEEDYRRARCFANASWNVASKQKDHTWRNASARVLSLISYKQGDLHVSRERIAYVTEMSQILGETKTICAAFGLLGCISFQSGDYGVAKSYLLKALALYRKIEHKPGEAEILNDLGYLILPFGSYAEEKRYLAEAL